MTSLASWRLLLPASRDRVGTVAVPVLMCWLAGFVGAGLGQSAAGAVIWNWSYAGTEAGTFTTDGTLADAAGSYNFTVNDFSVTGSRLRLATSYTLGTAFSGVLTWANESFASIGLTAGTYATTLSGGDAGATFTVNVVPEPSSFAMVAVGLACGGVGLLRRRGVRGLDGCRGKARLVRSEG